MIAGIDNQSDISIYFQKKELKSLSEGKTVAGILIRIHSPHEQGRISTQINDSRQNLNGFGIGIDDEKYWGVKEDFELNIFIGREYFSRLQEKGRVGVRQSIKDGSKISLYYDLDDSNIAMLIDELEFYRDNKENYKELAQQQ